MDVSNLWSGNPYTIITYGAAFNAVFVYSLLKLSPSIKERAAAVILLASLTYSFQTSLPTWTNNRNLRVLLVSGAWTTFWHALELLLVSKATSKDLGECTASGQIHSAASLLWNCRRIGTKWQIDKTTRFNAEGRIPSRAQFLLRMTLVGVGTILFLDFVSSTSPPPDSDMIAPHKQLFFSRLSEVSLEEAVFRTISSVVFLLCACTGVTMFYNIIVVFAVLTNLSAPASCPPAYGPFKEAYTMRGYWG